MKKIMKFEKATVGSWFPEKEREKQNIMFPLAY
jgi:hypothetical protein